MTFRSESGQSFQAEASKDVWTTAAVDASNIFSRQAFAPDLGIGRDGEANGLTALLHAGALGLAQQQREPLNVAERAQLRLEVSKDFTWRASHAETFSYGRTPSALIAEDVYKVAGNRGLLKGGLAGIATVGANVGFDYLMGQQPQSRLATRIADVVGTAAAFVPAPLLVKGAIMFGAHVAGSLIDRYRGS
jgi:hypothetical protein